MLILCTILASENMINSQIRVLSKSKSTDPKEPVESSTSSKNGLNRINRSIDLDAFKLKHESEATTFKLIDEKEWNIVNREPTSESQFFCDGNPLMSVISVIGPFGVGKSSLLNRIANKYAFETHCSNNYAPPNSNSPSKIHTKHLTRGVDIHVTHHRILLDCQPLLSHSVMEDFLAGPTGFQGLGRDNSTNDPYSNSHVISLQLAAFLIATCDYVVIMNKWLIDSSLMQLIATALMMLGEGNYKAKLIMFSEDEAIYERKFKNLTNSCLGMNQVDRYFCNERELINYISSYSSEKCDQIEKNPTGLTGRKWLAYSKKLWCNTIKDSLLFTDYAMQASRSNNPP